MIEPYIFEWTGAVSTYARHMMLCLLAQQKGSISAEHGLGFKKANYIHYSKSINAINLMQQIKQLFDPNVCLLIKIIIIMFLLFRIF